MKDLIMVFIDESHPAEVMDIKLALASKYKYAYHNGYWYKSGIEGLWTGWHQASASDIPKDLRAAALLFT